MNITRWLQNRTKKSYRAHVETAFYTTRLRKRYQNALFCGRYRGASFLMKINSKNVKFPLLKRFSTKRSFYHVYIPPRTRRLKIVLFFVRTTHSQANHCITTKALALRHFANTSMYRLIGRNTSLDKKLNAELTAGGRVRTKTDWNSWRAGRSRPELATSTSDRNWRRADWSVA